MRRQKSEDIFKIEVCDRHNLAFKSSKEIN